MNGKITEISRKELYEQVWTEPMSTLAKRYCVSDVGLAKICKRNGKKQAYHATQDLTEAVDTNRGEVIQFKQAQNEQSKKI